MSIIINDKVYRNIQEQVLKNLEDIKANRELIDLHYETGRVIAELGVRIIGKVGTFDEIRNVIPTQFGDGYAVGTPGNYTFYIWTRRSPTTPVEDGQWLELGPLAVPGPEGPSPVMGNDGTYITATNPETGEVTHVIPLVEIKGERGNTWRVGRAPQINGTEKTGDMALDTTNGNVYNFTNGQWILVMNIKGPQGNIGRTGPSPIIETDGIYITSTDPQTGETKRVIALSQIRGQRGEKGDMRAIVDIKGIKADKNQLPPITSYHDAYLVGANKEVYIPVGETLATAQWEPMGPINAATLVTVNGIYQTSWDADTKLDKDTSNTPYNQAYVKAADGGQGTINVTKQVIGDAIPQRNSDGSISVPTPDVVASTSAVSRHFLDKGHIEYKPYLSGLTQSLSDETINYTDRNPHATAQDPTLTGIKNTGATGSNSVSLNGNTIALASRSVAINNKTIAKGAESLAGGYQSVTLFEAESSLAFGEYNVTGGNSSVAFGNGTQALGDHSLTYGYETIANSVCSLAGGNASKAYAENAVALGSNCRAFGPHSVALGDNSFTSLNAYAGFAAGLGINASSDYQAAVGRYNEALEGNMFEVGNGDDSEHRKNIFSVTRDGRAKADTIPVDNNDLTNKLYVDSKSIYPTRIYTAPNIAHQLVDKYFLEPGYYKISVLSAIPGLHVTLTNETVEYGTRPSFTIYILVQDGVQKLSVLSVNDQGVAVSDAIKLYVKTVGSGEILTKIEKVA